MVGDAVKKQGVPLESESGDCLCLCLWLDMRCMRKEQGKRRAEVSGDILSTVMTVAS